MGKQRLYRYVIGNIGVTGAAQTCSRLDGEGGGGEIHGPEHHPSGGEVDPAGVDDAENLGTVQGEVAPVHGHAKPRDAGTAAGTGHVVEADAGVEVMAAAGASADGGTATTVAVGKDVAAETDDEGWVHKGLSNLRVVTLRLLDFGCQEKSQEKAAVVPVMGWKDSLPFDFAMPLRFYVHAGGIRRASIAAS